MEPLVNAVPPPDVLLFMKVYDQIKNGLKQAYGQLKIGNPLDENNHMGPLIDKAAVAQYTKLKKR